MEAKSNDKSFFQELKSDITDEHLLYLSKHPEIKEFMKDFLASVLTVKPQNVFKYIPEFVEVFGQKEPKEHYGPFVICGPSGVGKGTLIKFLLETFPDKFTLSTSTTTRDPRPGEQHGREYYFTTRPEFLKMVEKDAFIEYGEVHGNLYGTSRGVIDNIIAEGKVCILEIDVVGAEKVSKTSYSCSFLFIMPPSLEELKKRLEGRATEPVEVVERRMNGAMRELKFAEESELFKNKLYNIDLEKSKKELVEFLNKQYKGLNLVY